MVFIPVVKVKVTGSVVVFFKQMLMEIFVLLPFFQAVNIFFDKNKHKNASFYLKVMMMVVIVRLIFILMSQSQVIQHSSHNYILTKIIIYPQEILVHDVRVLYYTKKRQIYFCFMIYSLGGSGSKTLQLSAVHRDDIKTFEGTWKIVISKTKRTPFPPMTRKTLQRGSYIEVKEHIMK
jgi:hypothetical protein